MVSQPLAKVSLHFGYCNIEVRVTFNDLFSPPQITTQLILIKYDMKPPFIRLQNITML